MDNSKEIFLYAGDASDGTSVRESTLAYPINETDFRLIVSPALVYGVAANGVIRITEPEHGYFELISRGGNISIQVYSDELNSLEVVITERIVRLGGILDGINQGVCVYTVPACVGFDKIEDVFTSQALLHHEFQWFYGNVYADDGETPLNWWL